MTLYSKKLKLSRFSQIKHSLRAPSLQREICSLQFSEFTLLSRYQPELELLFWVLFAMMKQISERVGPGELPKKVIQNN